MTARECFLLWDWKEREESLRAKGKRPPTNLELETNICHEIESLVEKRTARIRILRPCAWPAGKTRGGTNLNLSHRNQDLKCKPLFANATIAHHPCHTVKKSDTACYPPSVLLLFTVINVGLILQNLTALWREAGEQQHCERDKGNGLSGISFAFSSD